MHPSVVLERELVRPRVVRWEGPCVIHGVGRGILRQQVTLGYKEPVGRAPGCDWQIFGGQKLRSIAGRRPRRQPAWTICHLVDPAVMASPGQGEASSREACRT